MKYILLLLPCIAAVAAPFYNSIEPRLFGFPMLYWFVLLMVPVTCLFMLIVYMLEGGEGDR